MKPDPILLAQIVDVIQKMKPDDFLFTVWYEEIGYDVYKVMTPRGEAAMALKLVGEGESKNVVVAAFDRMPATEASILAILQKMN